MKSNVLESRTSGYLAIGVVVVTLIVTDRISTEPVNVPKMVALTGLAGMLFAVALWSGVLRLLRHRKLLLLVASFAALLITSSLFSENPFERGFYGAFARNTGALTYTSLAFLMLYVSTFELKSSYLKIIKAFIFAAIANAIYCLFAGAGLDIFTWSNPFNGAVLGTFGNPNFIGAFMGIFVSTLFVFLAHYYMNKKYLILIIIGIALSMYVIKLSDALQGALIPAFGFAIVSIVLLRSTSKYKRLLLPLTVIYGVGFVIGAMGILNKGPLGSLLYKPSLTFRGEYWQAGLNMGFDNPLLGVGIDSYGSYFRTFRRESATVLPGVDVTTDTAHNVFIDIFSGGGFTLLAIYLAFNLLVAKNALNFFRKKREFDFYFTFFFVGWATYTIQSIFSINQIGLAIWGWVFGGAIIGYSRIDLSNATSLNSTQTKSGLKKKNLETIIPAGAALSLFIGFVVGILIALPPMIKDTQFRNLQTKSGDSQQLINLVQSWPLDSSRLNRGSVLLANSGMNVLAAQVAAYSTSAFPNDYAAWYTLFELSGEGSEEREKYREILNRIDPYNPRYFAK